MSVNQERVQIVTAETIGIRLTVRETAKKAFQRLVAFVTDLLGIGGEDQHTWARIERVKWHQGMRHEPTDPQWYRSW